MATAAGETWVGAFDVGGTKTVLAVVAGDGRIVARRRLPTPRAPEVEAFCALLAKAWRHLVEEVGRPVRAVGLAAPGPVDPRAGVLHQVFDWPWRDVPLAALLRERLGLPVVLDNDVNCCCLAERAWGAARGAGDFAWVQVSTGVGAGLVLGGELYQGAAGLAGEIGHVVLEEGGPACACGRRGCLQALVSGPAIARRWAERSGRSEADAREVFRLAARDREARAVVAEVARDLGRGLACLVNLLNPGLVVLGGGVMGSLAAYLPEVRAHVRARVIGEANQRVPVVATAVGYDAPLLGAAVLALHRA